MSAAASLEQHLLDTLTPEEREAITGADPKEIESLKNLAGGSADAKDDDDDDDDDDAADGNAPPADGAPPAAAPAADDKTTPPAPAAAAPAAAAAPVAEDDDDEAPVAAPYSYKLPDDYEERIASNKAAKDEVYTKLKAGDISADDLPAELDKLNDEAAELRDMRQRAAMAEDMTRQAFENQKQAAVNRLFTDAAKPENGGIDYKKDAAAAADLDTFVKALAGRQENAEKPLKWFLGEAHKRVLAMHGKTPAPSSAPSPTPAANAPRPTRTAPIADAPKSLASVPGGDAASDIGDEFGDILDLKGEAYEQAIARMAKTDPARFARFENAQ